MLGPGTGAWTPPSDLTAIAAKLATATPSGAPGGVVTPGVLGETAYGLNLPPLLQGVAGPTRPGGFTAPNTSTPAYGYGLAFGRSVWLGLQGPGMSPLLTANAGQHPWGWLSQFQPALWNKVNQAFTDALARAKSLRDPFTMYASQVFQSAVGRVGATVTGDWGAVLGEVVDFLAGFLNGLTGGLLGHVIGLGEWLTGINLNGIVDTSSSAYAAGGQTAGVALLVLMVAAPGAMPALLAMQALGQGWSAAEAFQRGDYATGFLDLGNGILAGVGAGAAAEAGEAGRLAASEAEAPAAAETAAEAVPAGAAEAPAAGLGAAEGEAGAALNPEQAGMPAPAEPPVEGPDLYPTDKACSNGFCFTAEMLLDYEDGRKRAERLREGDLLWSRDESNPNGPLVLKRVEKVFVRVGPVTELRLRGQVIRTTAEHRFFEAGKGWTPVCALGPGDTVMTREGLRLAVEGVADGGVETLYNGRIADCHTYFVSADQWSVSVWAHNTDEGCGPTQTPGEGEEGGTGAEGAPKNVTISDRNLQKVFDKHGDDFGLSGNWNPGRADDVRNAILDHINSPSVQRISGTYRGMQVTHVVDPNTGLNVILDGAGNFIGGWKLSAEQLQSVLNGGRLF